jgi:hypothetical protein
MKKHIIVHINSAFLFLRVGNVWNGASITVTFHCFLHRGSHNWVCMMVTYRSSQDLDCLALSSEIQVPVMRLRHLHFNKHPPEDSKHHTGIDEKSNYRIMNKETKHSSQEITNSTLCNGSSPSIPSASKIILSLYSFVGDRISFFLYSFIHMCVHCTGENLTL